MVKSKIVIIGILALLQSSQLSAQTDRFMVFFTDKDNSNYSITNPEEFLSERSILRRTNQGISITEEDLPVNESYIQGITEIVGADVYHRTKWLNGVIVQATSEELTQIEALSYVDRTEFIAPGSKLGGFIDNAPTWNVATEPETTTNSSGFQLRQLRVNYMQEDGYTGEGIMIAVMDGGFTMTNESKAFEHILQNDKLVASMDFVDNDTDVYHSSSHGTSVLSCIAAKYNDQMIGTAYDASFILCKTEDVSEEYRIEEYNWLVAAEYADSIGVDVINSSVGYNTFDDISMDYVYEDLDGETSIITIAQDLAFSKGILTVTSAGNSGNSSWRFITTPSDAKNVIAVGAVDASGNKSSFSSFGPTADGRIKPDVAAYGSATVIINGSGNISTKNGTSFAAPLIAGFAASLWQARPELTNTQLKQLIISSASNISDPNNEIGNGIPNYLIAVDKEVLNVQEILAQDVNVYPNPVSGNYLTLQLNNDLNWSGLKVAFIDMNGKSVIKEKINYQGESRYTLDVSTLSKGAYIVKISVGNKSRKIRILKN